MDAEFKEKFNAEMKKLRLIVRPRWIGGCRQIEIELIDEGGSILLSGIGERDP
jgi:hypothetical protein